MCIFALKSMTLAQKALKNLVKNYINAEIVKLEPHMTKKGCAFGIGINCINLEISQRILKENSIKYSEIIYD